MTDSFKSSILYGQQNVGIKVGIFKIGLKCIFSWARGKISVKDLVAGHVSITKKIKLALLCKIYIVNDKMFLDANFWVSSKNLNFGIKLT